MNDKQPRLGVAVIVYDDDGKLILGRRGRGPTVGSWVLPGGGVELGERWQAAGVREYLEETGYAIEIRDTKPVHVMEMIGKISHRLALVVRGYPLPKPRVAPTSDELAEVRAFHLWEVPVDGLGSATRECLMALQIVPQR
jgi:ADP-ribose pyrophosphatase YjhB (NUDIX family)